LLVLDVLIIRLFWRVMDGRTGGSGVASPAVEPSVQSGWKGWDVWVALDSAWRFAARWLRQLAEGPLLNRSLFAGAGVGSNGVLPVALVTTILLAGALFRSPQGGPTRLGRANQTFEASSSKCIWKSDALRHQLSPNWSNTSCVHGSRSRQAAGFGINSSSGPNLSGGSGIRPARLRAAAGSLMAGAMDRIVPVVVEVKEVIAPTGFAQAAPCAPGDFGDA
jgi:hypothetical protein